MLGPGRGAWPALALTALLLWASGAQAHPLGNFSVNHQTRVKISRDRIELLYILDQAEIPTFQERKLSGRETLQRKAAEVRDNLRLIVDGKRVQLHVGPGATISFPRGQGGLQTTRVELPIVYRMRGRAACRDPRPDLPRARRLDRHRRRAGARHGGAHLGVGARPDEPPHAHIAASLCRT